MSKTIISIDQRSSVTLPPEALDALGVEARAELEVEIVGRALVVRSVEEARRSREFMTAFESILSRRRTGYKELAKGLIDKRRAASVTNQCWRSQIVISSPF